MNATTLVAPYLLSACVSAILGAFALRHRGTPVAWPFALLMLCQVGWTLGLVVELYAPDLHSKIVLDVLQWLPSFGWFLCMSALWFALHERSRRWRQWFLLATTLPVLAFGVSLAIDPLSYYQNAHLVPLGPFLALHYDFGLVMSGLMLYLSLLHVMGIGGMSWLLLQPRRQYRAQFLLLTVATVVPLISFLASTMGWAPAGQRDLSPYAFLISSLMMAMALFRFGLVSGAPIARSRIFEILPEPVIVLNAERTVSDVNAAAGRVLGRDPDSLIGEPLSCLESLWPGLSDRVRSGQGGVVHGTTGRAFDLHMASLEHGAMGIVLHDVTGLERMRAELAGSESRLRALVEARNAELSAVQRQLLQSQKMEALGTLAGGIAHDFNNAMQIVSFHLDELEERQDPDLQTAVEEMKQAIHRTSTLTRQLLMVGRQQPGNATLTDVNQVLRRLEVLLERTLPRNLRVSVHADEGLPHAVVDPGKLEQALLNLCLNARDAMPDGGDLSLAARADHGVLRIDVRDTGCGMPKDVSERIFEPFFTTKPVGQGTGLGLAMVYRTINDQDGTITVDSEPGIGTIFHITLPMATWIPEDEQPAAPQVDPVDLGGVTVLVVDDEAPLRNQIRRVIERAGATVVVAESGERALKEHGRQPTIGLALIDIDMPGMGGMTCMDRLMARDPTLPVVLMSGVRPSVTLPGECAFLPKPFSSAGLLTVLQRHLESTQGPRARSRRPL